MKRFLMFFVVLTFLLMIVSSAITIHAEPPIRAVVELTIGDPYMYVNIEQQEIDPGRGTTAVIVSSRTVLPIRAVIEAIGGVVTWDEVERKVTVVVDDATVEIFMTHSPTYVEAPVFRGVDKPFETEGFYEGSKMMRVDGVASSNDVAPMIMNDRMFLPFRFIAESVGSVVEWDDSSKKVTLTHYDEVTAEPTVAPTTAPVPSTAPTVAPSATPTEAPSASPTPAPSATPVPSATPTPAASTPSPTPRPTSTPRPTPTPSSGGQTWTIGQIVTFEECPQAVKDTIETEFGTSPAVNIEIDDELRFSVEGYIGANEVKCKIFESGILDEKATYYESPADMPPEIDAAITEAIGAYTLDGLRFMEKTDEIYWRVKAIATSTGHKHKMEILEDGTIKKNEDQGPPVPEVP